MSTTVVVGIDGSAVAEEALRFAAHEADLRGGRLVVAHAGDVPGYDDGDPAVVEVHEFADILRSEAVATVAALYPHVVCETVIRSGDPSRLLLELSADAALLVIGTHRFGRLTGFVLGSVSQRVADHADCPVVTVSGPPGAGPIVLGASNTPGGLAALRFACTEARLRSSGVHAVRAVSAQGWALLSTEFTAVPPDLRAAAEVQLDAVLVAAAAEFPDVAIDGEVSMADPCVALQKHAEEAQLVVVGVRRDPASRLSHLGPVAVWLLHHSHSPLAVVGHPQAESASGTQDTGT